MKAKRSRPSSGDDSARNAHATRHERPNMYGDILKGLMAGTSLDDNGDDDMQDAGAARGAKRVKTRHQGSESSSRGRDGRDDNSSKASLTEPQRSKQRYVKAAKVESDEEESEDDSSQTSDSSVTSDSSDEDGEGTEEGGEEEDEEQNEEEEEEGVVVEEEVRGERKDKTAKEAVEVIDLVSDSSDSSESNDSSYSSDSHGVGPKSGAGKKEVVETASKTTAPIPLPLPIPVPEPVPTSAPVPVPIPTPALGLSGVSPNIPSFEALDKTWLLPCRDFMDFEFEWAGKTKREPYWNDWLNTKMGKLCRAIMRSNPNHELSYPVPKELVQAAILKLMDSPHSHGPKLKLKRNKRKPNKPSRLEDMTTVLLEILRLTTEPEFVQIQADLGMMEGSQQATQDHQVNTDFTVVAPDDMLQLSDQEKRQLFFPGSADRELCLHCVGISHSTEKCPQLVGQGVHREIWQSFDPAEATIRKVKDIPVFCYTCGAMDHYGPECREPSLSEPVSGSTIWAEATRSLYVDPGSSEVAIAYAGIDLAQLAADNMGRFRQAAVSEFAPPPTGVRSKHRVQYISSDGDSDDEVFLRAPVQNKKRTTEIRISTNIANSSSSTKPAKPIKPPRDRRQRTQSQRRTNERPFSPPPQPPAELQCPPGLYESASYQDNAYSYSSQLPSGPPPPLTMPSYSYPGFGNPSYASHPPPPAGKNGRGRGGGRGRGRGRGHGNDRGYYQGSNGRNR